MTVRQAVLGGVKQLGTKVETPFLDAVILLSTASGWSKEKILASFPEQLPAKVEEMFEELLVERMTGTPVSYIRGTREFYSLEFTVGPGTLVPRPETEILVDAVVKLAQVHPDVRSLHDACTGSGCIGISIKHSIPALSVSASDISPKAAEYFKKNCAALLKEEIPFVESYLLKSVNGRYDVITANPPYLTSETWEKMNQKRWPEPAVALDGGPDGLKYYRELIPMSVLRLRPGGLLFLEADPSQFEAIEKMLVQNGFHTAILYKDLADRNRVIRGCLGTGSEWKT